MSRSAVRPRFRFLIVLLLGAVSCQAPSQRDPLPSWRDGSSRQAIVDFVVRVTDEDSPDFVPQAERIAVFDNDGTLWAEKPLYVQAAFVFDRVRALAPEHPEWQQEEPYASVLRGDEQAALAGGEKALLQMVLATHAGMTASDFRNIVTTWMDNARHPDTQRPYTEMIYQPMRELLDYLRDNGFETWIVSGGGIEFMRPWSERVYGIPPQQVVGSSVKTRYEMRNGRPAIVRLAELEFVDDKAGKPVAINKHIGRRPIAAFGNSDGDLQMLEWTAAGDGARFCLLVHHTDAEREWAYNRESHVGRLDKALDEAQAHAWTVVDMKQDWATIFPE
jgi:phosphoserine phosphatase